MTSEAQIKANQENAKKSTGPTSIEGKKRSSMNAMTHGVFAQIPILPGEDVEALTSLADAINNTYKPRDAMELMLVERIIMATFRQIRLREAEAANIKINMTEERITESLNISMEVPYLDRFKSHDLTLEKETYYQYLLEVSKEIKDQGDKFIDYSVDTIKNNMSYTFELLKQKPTEYKTTWDVFIKNSEMIKIAMKEIKDGVNTYLEKNKFAHAAFYLLEEIKTIHRLPNSTDMALFNRYQTQFDNELYRAMNALQKFRESQGKLMKSQITIEEDISEYAAV